ncbi:MAG: magnesium transporter, partial [Psychroserpens sp.]|nr:magnesium transporter [Psychroserpens sp.]
MIEEKENNQFELTDELIADVELLVSQNQDKELITQLNDYHYADIAEILDELSLDDAVYVIKLLDSELTSDIITELD